MLLNSGLNLGRGKRPFAPTRGFEGLIHTYAQQRLFFRGLNQRRFGGYAWPPGILIGGGGDFLDIDIVAKSLS